MDYAAGIRINSKHAKPFTQKLDNTELSYENLAGMVDHYIVFVFIFELKFPDQNNRHKKPDGEY